MLAEEVITMPPPKKPETDNRQKFTTTLDKDLLDFASRLAGEMGKGKRINDVIEQLLREKMRERGEEPPA